MKNVDLWPLIFVAIVVCNAFAPHRTPSPFAWSDVWVPLAWLAGGIVVVPAAAVVACLLCIGIVFVGFKVLDRIT